jgi:hypothetical protein
MSIKKITLNYSLFKSFYVESSEFNRIPNEEFCNLILLDKLDLLKNRVGFLIDLMRSLLFSHNNKIVTIVFDEPTHGGYVFLDILKHLIKLHLTFPFHIYIRTSNVIQRECVNKNFINSDIKHKIPENIRIEFIHNCDSFNVISSEYLTFFISETDFIGELDENIVFFGKTKSSIRNHNKYTLKDHDEILLIPRRLNEQFLETFRYYLEESDGQKSVINYRNLIHYTMIVKNAGDIFEEVLTRNLPYIDQWTILDTGSTDNTIDIINKVLVGKKRGQLYCEPFINFRDSRNRCLDLADNSNTCIYTVMLDDTYILEGPLSNFLKIVSADQFADSFSLYIKSDDTQYVSNRILFADRGLRYIYKIHEVIQNENNKNVIVPLEHGKILDLRCDYMEKRTMDRKEYDLKLLFEEVEENPEDPRHYYYIAQTYNLLENHEAAYEYFLKRANHPNEGFLQEKIDAIFEAARLSNFQLNRPWEECEALYKWAYSLDKSRPDSLYFLGIHYYLEGNRRKAYEYFVEGFRLGYPVHAQYSLKPTLSYYFLPKFLTELCYEFNNYKLGEQVSYFFLEHNKPTDEYYSVMKDWCLIYRNLNKMKRTPFVIRNELNTPLLVFLADGGFSNWTGRYILTRGVGGSETWVIEMARHIQRMGHFKVIVFCKCDNYDLFEGVEYRPLEEYFSFVVSNKVDTVIVSRFSEYLPVAFKGDVRNVYLIAHDLTPSGLVIPIDPKLKKIFCLTEWHVSYMNQVFPQLSHLTTHLYYGIDSSRFDYRVNKIKKIRNKFIYSSFPNRGLLELLQMWPKIYKKHNDVTLHIYSDIDGTWVNQVEPQMMRDIRALLNGYKMEPNGLGIHYHGWVGKAELAEAWKSAEYWLYPCTFQETFCLTALEAASSKTLAITNNLAALENTVGDRGLVVKGDPRSIEWQRECLEKLFDIMNDDCERERLLEKNYEWSHSLTWENRAKYLVNEFLLFERSMDVIINYFNSKNISNPRVLSLSLNNNDFIGKIKYSKITRVNTIDDLITLIKNNEMFDFIYLENNNIYDNYLWDTLSFQILNCGGILCLLNDGSSDRFLEKNMDKIRILNRGKYIFIENK